MHGKRRAKGRVLHQHLSRLEASERVLQRSHAPCARYPLVAWYPTWWCLTVCYYGKDHRNSGFPDSKWWFSIVMLNYRWVYIVRLYQFGAVYIGVLGINTWTSTIDGLFWDGHWNIHRILIASWLINLPRGVFAGASKKSLPFLNAAPKAPKVFESHRFRQKLSMALVVHSWVLPHGDLTWTSNASN